MRWLGFRGAAAVSGGGGIHPWRSRAFSAPGFSDMAVVERRGLHEYGVGRLPSHVWRQKVVAVQVVFKIDVHV